ncbi:MAG TPA: hypothetical protein VFE49_07525 [Jiangellaceae bacterium]|nr:hypothetical protein [Jiangellaceae bacterium]
MPQAAVVGRVQPARRPAPAGSHARHQDVEAVAPPVRTGQPRDERRVERPAVAVRPLCTHLAHVPRGCDVRPAGQRYHSGDARLPRRNHLDRAVGFGKPPVCGVGEDLAEYVAHA